MSDIRKKKIKQTQIYKWPTHMIYDIRYTNSIYNK